MFTVLSIESKTAKKVKGGDDQVQVDPDSGPELKEALEVRLCTDYGGTDDVALCV